MQNTQPVTPHAYPAALPMESNRSAVSWGAVIAGAVAAAAVSAMLITGGTGLGFLSLSPWHQEGASGTAIAVGTIIWLFFTQIIAYGIAGYITGRLRTKWTDAAADEIYFRDTAHGFLVWALSALVTVILVGSTVASAISGTARAGASIAAGTGAAAVGGLAAAGAQAPSLDYFADALLRPADPAMAPTNGADTQQQVLRILARSIMEERLPEADQTYLTQLVARQAGVDEATARQRLDEIAAQARQAAADAEQQLREAADAARKAAAIFSLWAFASMLIGAFVASLAATYGGRARDRF